MSISACICFRVRVGLSELDCARSSEMSWHPATRRWDRENDKLTVNQPRRPDYYCNICILYSYQRVRACVRACILCIFLYSEILGIYPNFYLFLPNNAIIIYEFYEGFMCATTKSNSIIKFKRIKKGLDWNSLQFKWTKEYLIFIKVRVILSLFFVFFNKIAFTFIRIKFIWIEED